jgi:hypothetical protein
VNESIDYRTQTAGDEECKQKRNYQGKEIAKAEYNTACNQYNEKEVLIFLILAYMIP